MIIRIFLQKPIFTPDHLKKRRVFYEKKNILCFPLKTGYFTTVKEKLEWYLFIKI